MDKNILIPRDLDRRKEKLRQINIMLLQQEVIEGDLEIDDTFLDIPNELVKVKEINGNLKIIKFEIECFPEWLKNIRVKGHFDCSFNKLKDLTGMPYLVEKDLICNYSDIQTCKGMTKVKGNYILESNHDLTSISDIKYIKYNKNVYIHNSLKISNYDLTRSNVITQKFENVNITEYFDLEYNINALNKLQKLLLNSVKQL